MRNQLSLNSAKGAWPRTIVPFKPYRETDFVEFDEWWNQEFHVWFTDVTFTRGELIEAIRHKEGGGHVDEMTLEKIAVVRRARSGWHKSIKDKEDGTTEMYVGFSVTKGPLPEDSDLEEISDYELACMCAIAEEVLFSLTPEPDNRLRMHHPDMQEPFYWTQKQSNEAKAELENDLVQLGRMKEGADPANAAMIDAAERMIRKTLEIDRLTSEDFGVRRGVATLLKVKCLPWDEVNGGT